jgi:hypothetical protein
MALMSSMSLSAQQKLTRYAVKSGYIKYELTGSTKGQKEIWWDNFGAWHCEKVNATTTVKMFGIKDIQKEQSLTIMKGEQIWTVDYTAKNGTKGKLPYYKESHKLMENMSEQELKDFSDELLLQLGGEKMSTESFMGYTCDVMKVLGSKSWIYKGICLKSTARVMGIENNETASVFKPGAKVSSSKFTPPSDVVYEDIEQHMPTNFWGATDDEDELNLENEMEQVKKVARMPYADFKEMMQRENPEMSEEEIKRIYNMTKAFGGQ